MKKSKKIAVIGAGLSGLAAIKELTEAGHTVVCYEKSDRIGGVFSNDETYDSLLLTVSNYFMAYSDFMPVKERMKFWTKKDYCAYLDQYVDHFGFRDCIRFGADVDAIERRGENWKVKLCGEDSFDTFDCIAVCSGQFQKKKMPNISGLDIFSGTVMHSTDYRNPDSFKGKKVLCIGMGESSADITAEIADVADKTILSLRRHQFIAPRFIGIHGWKAFDPKSYTIDTITTRFMHQLPKKIHSLVLTKRFNTFRRSYNPSTRLQGEWNYAAGQESRQVVTKNERVFDAIADNKVQANIGGVKEIRANSVVFNDGSEQEIDTIVCCTGFEFSLPSLDVNIDGPRELYKQMFHPELGRAFAFIGFARPQQGGVPAIAEMQARYFALLCSEERALPENDAMRSIIVEDKAFWEREFSITPHIQGMVNYVYYMDDIARKIGCDVKINPLKDLPLYLRCLYGPQWAVQYRLRGPGAKPNMAKKVLENNHPVPMKWRFAMITLLTWFIKLLPLGDDYKPRNRAKYIGID